MKRENVSGLFGKAQVGYVLIESERRKESRADLEQVRREAHRAAKIVRNLLVFAGSRRLVKRSVSLTAVLQKAADHRVERVQLRRI